MLSLQFRVSAEASGMMRDPDKDCFNCGDKLTECKCGDTETYDNDEGVICPYCGCMNKACDSDGMLYSESITEYDCDECSREFEVSVGIHFSWKGSRLDDQ